MRVLHFCERFSTLSETFIFDLITELEHEFGEQHVATVVRELASERPFKNVHVLQNRSRWDLHRLRDRLAEKLRLTSRFESNWPELRAGLKTVVDRVRPAILHAHFGPAGIIAAPVARQARIPLVVSFYGYDASQLLDDPDWSQRIEVLLRQSRAVVALSSEMRDRLLESGAEPERTFVVHLGKRIDQYRFLPRPKVRRFLSVGRIVEKKGHFDAVAAFGRVAAECPDAHFDLVGGGTLLTALRAYVDESGLASRITLHGACPHDRVKTLFDQADAFVLCSKRALNGDCEGTPTVLLEAQAAGLPCVSTFHAGIPESIPVENHHLLSPEGDIAAVRERMMWLVSAPAAELSSVAQNGRRHVQERFNISIEARKLHDVYSAILRNTA